MKDGAILDAMLNYEFQLAMWEHFTSRFEYASAELSEDVTPKPETLEERCKRKVREGKGDDDT